MDTQNTESPKDSSTEFNIQTVNLLLDTAKAEYDKEHSRTCTIDSKTNISLPIISAFFLALVQLNDYKTIFQLSTDTFAQWLLPATLFSSYTIALILGFVAVLLMTLVILTREYAVLNIRDLYNEDFLKNTPIFFSIQLIKLYCEANEENKLQNDKRVKWYRYSWILMLITLALYLVYIVIKTNI